MYLVDTNIISEAAPSRGQARHELVNWLDRNSGQLFLSAVTIAEVSDGIAKAKREKATRKARNLDLWMRTLLHLYGDRILPLDADVALECGRLSDAARAAGQVPGFADLIIAATARVHGLTLLTRNVRHFQFRGLTVVDPFRGLPGDTDG